MATPGSRIPFPTSIRDSKTPGIKLTMSPAKIKKPVQRAEVSAGFRKPKLPISSGQFRKPDKVLSTFGGKKRQVENVPPTELSVNKRIKIDTQTNSQLQRSRSTLTINGGFSEMAKRRAVLQPHPKSQNPVRESAPMVIEGKKPAKRPAWDIKGRMLDMESVNKELTAKLECFMEKVTRLEVDKSTLEQDFHTKSVVSEEAIATIERLENELKEKTAELDSTTREKNSKLQELRSHNDTLLCENTVLKTKISSMEQLVSSLTASHSTLKTEYDATMLLYTQTQAEKEKCETNIHQLKNENSRLENEVRELETERRKLHNTVQELKGNIRVFCRVRPSLPIEISKALPMSSVSISSNCKTLEISHMPDSGGSSGSIHKSKSVHDFTFDLVFGQNASQNEVFFEIAQLVQSALDGYHVCIFAYGQTGSGKTYTMEGPEDLMDFTLSSEDVRLGMIPRSVHQIFNRVEELQALGWKYKVETSFMEIYNENIRDLLVDNSHNSAPKCEIKRTASKGNDSYISNIQTMNVANAEQVSDLLKKARTNRAVASTNCNERSSRSHYIFQMKLFGEQEITGEKCEGILNLIDLAGSERVKESGSAGERFTEAKNINKSLSNLGNVIMALSQKADHVPYRNSKLTHLLMNSLGGQAKTLMFVNISPCEDHFNETVNSLRFATKVNQCNIGTAQKKYKN